MYRRGNTSLAGLHLNKAPKVVFYKKNCMKPITITACLFLLFACNSTPEKPTTTDTVATSTTTSKSDTVQNNNIDSATAAQNWESYMTPGEPHQQMASWNGTWSGATTMWTSPDAPPVTTTFTTVNKMILGGRYQQTSHKGKFEGQPFEGISTLAYDNSKKEYISTWIDNMGTGLMVAKGHWDSASNTIVFRGVMVDPATGRDIEVKEIFKPIDNNYQVLEMYTTAPGGKEFKSMEIKFTRR